MFEDTDIKDDDEEESPTRRSFTEELDDLSWDGLLEALKHKDQMLNKAGEIGLQLTDQLRQQQDDFDHIRSQQEQEMEVCMLYH